MAAGGAKMKLIVKIEIALFLLVLLVAAGMILLSDGGWMLLEEPVIAVREVPPIPTEAPPEVEETVPATTAPPDQKEPPQVSATRYFAYDLRKDMFLAQKGDGDAKLYPASITKLLTCHVVLQYLEPDDKVTVGDAMNLVQFDSSLANLKEGDELTVEQLVAAMMLPSGNDAAQVAAVAAGRAIAGDKNLDYQEAVKVFVKQMNAMAQELGMSNSRFVTPDGWHDDDHYTTMNDLVILCQAALENETILKYTSKATDSVLMADRNLEWKNTNMLLHENAETYVPATIGLKTGYTSNAGGCLVSAFFQTDRIVLIGVFGCPAHTMDRYIDTVAIYNSL
jgi:D-alanyl-D-alanine carboxypeptidase (penicillin-binding protein 5/6)